MLPSGGGGGGGGGGGSGSGSGGGGGNLKLRQHYAGPLSKYTNVVKGWQYRWVVLNPDKGTLEYFVSEADAKCSRPRGSLHLAGAVISPSEEDSHTFVVNAASSDLYKLRAQNAKERQEWITRLRVVAELHSQAYAQSNSGLREGSGASSRLVPTNVSILDAFTEVTNWLTKAEQTANDIGTTIDRFPTSGNNAKSTDADLLVLKATSQATVASLEECLYALQLQQRNNVSKGKTFGSTYSVGK